MALSAGLPRRGFMGLSLAALALTGRARAQSGGEFQPLPQKVEIKDRQLTTAVQINGKGPFQFVVDTGADRTVISEDIAKALRLPPSDTINVQGIIRTVKAPAVRVGQLRFGTIARKKMQLPVLPREQLKADGYLGLDALGDSRVLFDFRGQSLKVFESKAGEAEPERAANETQIDAPGEGGHLRSLSCRVGDSFATAFIDTGAEVSVGNEALRAALAQSGTRDIELFGVTGGSRLGKVVQVQTILLGNLEFTGCEIAVADLDIFKIWGLADQPALLIGLNFLRAFDSVAIDFRRQEFRLKLASSGWVSRKTA